MVCRLQALPSLTSQCPAVARWAVAPTSPSGESSWVAKQGLWARTAAFPVAGQASGHVSCSSSLQWDCVNGCMLAPGSFGISWVPSGNEGKTPSELDKSCSGAGSNRHLTSLNFQYSSFQRHMLCLNLQQTYLFAYHSPCMSAMKFCRVDEWLGERDAILFAIGKDNNKVDLFWGPLTSFLATSNFQLSPSWSLPLTSPSTPPIHVLDISLVNHLLHTP